MPVFFYQGKLSTGKTVRGEIEAPTESEARFRLRSQRVIPIKLAPKLGGVSQVKASASFSFLGAEPKVKSKDLQVFTRQFATMINSGIPVVQAIEILQNQTASKVLRAALTKVRENVEGGKRLGESLEGWPGVFDRLYVSLVKAGEESNAVFILILRLTSKFMID